MEHSRKFELGKAATDYVRSVSEGQLSDNDQQELLDHLLDEVRGLQLAGLSPRESFIIARMRFGDQDLLQEEFRKIRPVYTLNQLMLKAIFLCISFSMILSLSPYLSFLSATTFSKFLDTSSYLFMVSDIAIKAVFIAGSLFAFYYLIFRRYRINPDFYIAALIIYILIGIVVYFTFGHLPELEPQLRSLLWKNTLAINSLALFSMIFYNLYLSSRENNEENIFV